MLLVVAFSSSLDVAAIEMELGLPLDYNKCVCVTVVRLYTNSVVYCSYIMTLLFH